MRTDRVYMLAADHRWQWEEWTGAHGVPATRIPEVKGLIFEAFLSARERLASLREYCALLIDEQYGAAIVERARSLGLVVGTSAEKPGVTPLQWTAPFELALTGDFAKVLINHRRECGADIMTRQFRLILALQKWCRDAGKALLIEILLPRMPADSLDFDDSGRPALLAGDIAEAYRVGVIPDFWKLEGTANADSAQALDEAVGRRAGARQLILGKGAPFDQIAAWFHAARHARNTVGFAIGRSVFWDPGTRFLAGDLQPTAAVRVMADRYVELVNLWNGVRANSVKSTVHSTTSKK